MHVAILEPVEERVNVTRREHVQVSRVVFGFSPREKPKPVLEAKRVRDGRDQASAGPQDALCLGHEAFRVADVLEQLAGDDDVEALVRERKRLVGVGPLRLDSELRGLRERDTVDVHADDVVSLDIRTSQRAIAAAEIQDAPARPADVAAEELDALFTGIDEVLAACFAVVLAVPFAELLEPAHDGQRIGRLANAGSTLAGDDHEAGR